MEFNKTAKQFTYTTVLLFSYRCFTHSHVLLINCGWQLHNFTNWEVCQDRILLK